MTHDEHQQRDHPEPRPIDESTYGGASSETGGNYSEDGPTTANSAGDSMSDEEERDSRPPEASSA